MNNKIRKILLGMLVIILSVAVPVVVFAAEPNGRRADKVIVFVLDNISLQDYQNQELTNFNRVIETGGLGLMNARVNSLTRTNRISSYLTMGMGVRVYVAPQVVQAAGSNSDALSELRIANFMNITEMVHRDQPNYIMGKIGETARVNNLRLAFVGNTDSKTPAYESLLLAVDSSGRIPQGNTGRQLLKSDADAPWGFSTDVDKLLQLSMAAIDRSDITFIDFGDTVRVSAAEAALQPSREEADKWRRNAMKKADAFVGQLINRLSDQRYVLMVVTPSPESTGTVSASRAVTPLVIYDKAQPAGILGSLTTKRDGLVSNIDIGPTIFSMLGLDTNSLSFLGKEITILPKNGDKMEVISRQLAEYNHLNLSRNLVHGLYVIIFAVSLLVLYLPLFRGGLDFPAKLGRTLAVMVVALPLVSFVIFPIVLEFPVAAKYYLDLLITVLAAGAAGLRFNRTWEESLKAMAWLSAVTSGLILFDLFQGWEFIIRTPLGFDNIFAGGRYYGINNDCMGLLLGSAFFCLFYVFEKVRPSRFIMAFIVLVVSGMAVLSQTPLYGANVGGTIATMTTGAIAFLTVLANRLLKRKWLFLIITLVFSIELLIAYMDYLFGWETHAGRVMGTLISQGLGGKLSEILLSKIRLFALMLVIPPYNLLLGLQLLIYYSLNKKMSSSLQRLRFKYPVLTLSFDVLLIGGITAFIFNDTGVIATALMLAYLTLPLRMALGSMSKAG